MRQINVIIMSILFVVTSIFAQHEGSHDHHSHNKSQNEKHHEASDIPAAFRSQLTTTAQVYLVLKDALVAGKDSLAKLKAVELSNQLKAIDTKLLKGELHEDWNDHLIALKDASSIVSKAGDLEARRSHFNNLSKAFISVLKAYGSQNATFYVQHCPMANGNKGGDWLSDSKEIRNPYFGDMMLKCGSVKEKIVGN